MYFSFVNKCLLDALLTWSIDTLMLFTSAFLLLAKGDASWNIQLLVLTNKMIIL